MTNYPNSLDDDTTIYRIDDNVTEIDGTTINQERDAIFAIEETLGVNPQGSKASVADRIDVSINKDGYLRSDAVQLVGLVSLPVTDSQVGTNAGIKESKLDLTHSTSDLYALGQNTISVVNGAIAQVEALETQLIEHAGGTVLRHKASNIDLDTAITTGSTSNLNTGVQAIDATLVDHISVNKIGAHTGDNISLNVSGFIEIPHSANNVQDAISALDNMDAIALGQHRATMHANGIPRTARTTTFTDGYLISPEDGYSDSYGDIVVPSSAVYTYLANTTLNVNPNDDVYTGDDIIDFSPSMNTVLFQTQFSQAQVGDWVFVDDGYGASARYIIDSIYYDVSLLQARVRINGTNLSQSNIAKAMIFKKRYDENTFGILAAAPVNAVLALSGSFVSGSVIVADPRGACALGTFFDPNQLDATHHKLYIQMFFQGSPKSDPTSYKVLPGIDVTGNQGTTPGAYTIDSVVQATNDAMRAAGFNYRMIAFAKDGKFGIMMADVIDKVAFSIVTSDPGASQATTNANYPNNVIDIYSTPGVDALGLGPLHANIASVAYNGVPSNFNYGSTFILTPQHNKTCITNGVQFDYLSPAPLANQDGYFAATVSKVQINGPSTEITYTILGNYTESGFKPGMTVVVAPSTYNNFYYYNYGRFIIKEVAYAPACTMPGDVDAVLLTVVNGISGTNSNYIPFPSILNMPVRVYFGSDSVGFDKSYIDANLPNIMFHRLFEIYVTDKKTTFAHERVRLDVPYGLSLSSSGITTTNWHILNASPKLKGGRMLSINTTNYNTTTGEFTASLADVNTFNNPGPVVTARKNVPFKLYDFNGNDYIEMIYVEPNSSGTSVEISRANIAIFPSLATDEEVFLLASCEVNWLPNGQSVVDIVTDRRQFGNINERDFTDSAKDYIASVPRYSASNGVIRGFDATATTNIVSLQGGSAVVNGNVVAINNEKVRIPIITATPTITQFVLCAGSSGNFEVKPLTATKVQVFTGGRYIDSVTFTELMDSRKELLPLYVITMSGSNISALDDVRKYSSGDFTGFTMASDGSVHYGTVRTWDAALNLFRYYDGFDELVISGSVAAKNVGATNLTILTNSAKHFVINGKGSGTILCENVAQSIVIGNNLQLGSFTFKNINFVTSRSLSSSDIVGVETGGIIYVNTSSKLKSLTITDCVFTNTATNNTMPPFINIYSPLAFDTLTIQNNKFYGPGYFAGNVSVFQYYAAITISTSGAGSQSYVIRSVNISNNYALGGMCLIGGRKIDAPMLGTDEFITILNLTIEDNVMPLINASCGTESSINITRNTAEVISNNLCLRQLSTTSVYSYGKYGNGSYLDSYSNGMGSINVSNNTCSIIDIVHTSWVNSYGAYPAAFLSSAKITGNTLQNTAPTAVSTIFFGLGAITSAIRVIGSYGLNNATRSVNAICDSNVILKANNNSTSDAVYGTGIYAVNCNVTNNSIYGFLSVGIDSSIHADAALGTAAYDISTNVRVSGNTIVRDDAATVTAFIKLSHNTTFVNSGTMCVDNILSHRTVNNADPLYWVPLSQGPILSYSQYDVIERNKNHVKLSVVPISTLNKRYMQFADQTSCEFISGYSDTAYVKVSSVTPLSGDEFYLNIDTSPIPDNTTLLSVICSFTVLQPSAAGKLAFLQFSNTTLQQDPTGANLSVIGDKGIMWSPTPFRINSNFRNLRFYFPGSVMNSSAIFEAQKFDFVVYYCF